MSYTNWMIAVEMLIGEVLPPAKYVWFFELWFYEKKSPRFAATYYRMISGDIS